MTTYMLCKCDKRRLFYEGRKNLQNDAFQQKKVETLTFKFRINKIKHYVLSNFRIVYGS
jgi:hypothetical protein